MDVASAQPSGNVSLMSSKHDMHTQFESDWRARITKYTTLYQQRMNHTYLNADLFVNPVTNLQEEKISVMQVEIAEPDLDAMIRQLKDANWHVLIQNKYPHLRAAYLEYLTLVHMTVDQDSF
jgi:hypothetical protein